MRTCQYFASIYPVESNYVTVYNAQSNNFVNGRYYIRVYKVESENILSRSSNNFSLARACKAFQITKNSKIVHLAFFKATTF